MSLKHLLALNLIVLTAASLHAADTIFTIDRTASGGVDIKVDGKPFATYVIDQVNKPYLWPIYGPTGKAMTRAYPMQMVEGEQHDHPHHRGITFGSESIGHAPWRFPEKWDGITGEEKYTGGGDTWHESTTFEEFMKDPKNTLRGKQRLPMLASIKHRDFTELKAGKEKAVVAETLDYIDPSGKRFLTEERRLTFLVLGDMRAIDFDQDFIASDGAVTFEDRKDAGLSIRVPTSMAVESKLGGKIINSNGITDVDAWGKPAAWCDYHGPVEGEQLGIAMLNHPSSFRYPTRWHVRPYGLFTANPFALHDYDKTQPSGDYELKAGERLKMRHRFLFHKGDEKAAKIAEAFEAYSK
ncbi:hypothetical protein BH11VER1_BH11VER1_24300 [soil metagenome]